MMEELQSHRNIRLAVVRQGGNNPAVPAGAKAPAKAPPQLPQQVPKSSAPRAQAQDDLGPRGQLAGIGAADEMQTMLAGHGAESAASRMPRPPISQAPPNEATEDALEKTSAPPPGLAKPLVPIESRPLGTTGDDPGDLIGSIDVQENGTNGPLRFQVVLARKGPGRLGIDVVLKREANFCGLLVYKVSEGGRVDAWNKQSQMPYRVLPGDHILEVNDVSISGDNNPQNDKFAVRMVQELSKDRKNVHFTVERVPSVSELSQEDESAIQVGLSDQGEARRRLEGQMMPRQVGPQQTPEGGQEADVAQGAVAKGGAQPPASKPPAKAQAPAQLQAPLKPGQPTPTPPAVAPKWQPKSSPALPGQKSEESDSVDVDLEPPQGALSATALADGEVSDQGPSAEVREEEEKVETAEKVEEEKDKDKDGKEPKGSEKEQEDADAALPAETEAADQAAKEGAEASPLPAMQKAPKAKPADSGPPLAPPPSSPSSRPLPPPPKVQAPPAPPKPQKEEKEAQAKSLPAPPAGPAPAPPQGDEGEKAEPSDAPSPKTDAQT